MSPIEFTRRQLLGSFLLAPSLLGGASATMAGKKAPELRSKSVSAIDFGTCVCLDQIQDDSRLREVIAESFTYLTPEYHLQWNSFEPSPNKFQFHPVDGIVAFARDNGMGVHGHSLLWEQGTPEWAKLQLGRDTPDWEIIRRHFDTVLTRYQAHMRAWNVINEPIDTSERSDGLRVNTFLKAFGPDYIERALETAREFAPTAKLLINDYSLEYDNPVDRNRRAATLKLIQRLRSRGVPLDGFGLQGHLDLGKGRMNARSVSGFLQQLADFELQIFVTELDVQERDFTLSLEKRDQKVADETKRFLDIVLEQPAVVGVTTWGVSDKYSWLKPLPDDLKKSRVKIPSQIVNRGLPFDSHMEAKPMSVVLADAFPDHIRTASLSGQR